MKRIPETKAELMAKLEAVGEDTVKLKAMVSELQEENKRLKVEPQGETIIPEVLEMPAMATKYQRAVLYLSGVSTVPMNQSSFDVLFSNDEFFDPETQELRR